MFCPHQENGQKACVVLFSFFFLNRSQVHNHWVSSQSYVSLDSVVRNMTFQDPHTRIWNCPPGIYVYVMCGQNAGSVLISLLIPVRIPMEIEIFIDNFRFVNQDIYR